MIQCRNIDSMQTYSFNADIFIQCRNIDSICKYILIQCRYIYSTQILFFSIIFKFFKNIFYFCKKMIKKIFFLLGCIFFRYLLFWNEIRFIIFIFLIFFFIWNRFEIIILKIFFFNFFFPNDFTFASTWPSAITIKTSCNATLNITYCVKRVMAKKHTPYWDNYLRSTFLK